MFLNVDINVKQSVICNPAVGIADLVYSRLRITLHTFELFSADIYLHQSEVSLLL